MRRSVMAVALLFATSISELALAQGPLARARDSYAAAAYEECIDALEGADLTPAQIAPAGEYRALCLLALDREPEAAAVIDKVIRAVPTYTAPPSSSPRLTTLVGSVRKAILPSVVQAEYAAAKRSYDARELDNAGEGFRLVLNLLKDPEIAAAPELKAADYETLASGFLDLIAARATPEPAPAPPPAIFTPEDTDVTPPVPQKQVMPRWNRPAASIPNMRHRGLLELIIDVEGYVESATLLDPVHPAYDDALLRAAREWTYEPARRNGQPVKFRKVLAINLETP